MAEVPAKEVLEWAVEMFGPIARSRYERACRFLEEAVELAQAEGVNVETVDAIATRVYSRPGGDVAEEIGQARMTLNCLAENAGFDAGYEEWREWLRVQAIDKDEWKRRHAAKVAIGIAG